jgi:hypothetical protein
MYILKVIAGLIIIGFAVFVTLVGDSFKLQNSLNWLLMVFPIGIFVLLFPLSYLIYFRMDELQKKLHEHASVASLTLLVSAAGLIGVLQANEIIPLFNQVWFLIAAIAVWGVALMFSDRCYK